MRHSILPVPPRIGTYALSTTRPLRHDLSSTYVPVINSQLPKAYTLIPQLTSRVEFFQNFDDARFDGGSFGTSDLFFAVTIVNIGGKSCKLCGFPPFPNYRSYTLLTEQAHCEEAAKKGQGPSDL